MELAGRTVALYGRFSPGVRDRLAREVVERAGLVLRDLTRRCDVFVVGAFAVRFVDSGALVVRLESARRRAQWIVGERTFERTLDLGSEGEATLPLAQATARSGLSLADVDLLAAFDLVEVTANCCRFGDAGVIRSAAELLERGRSRGDVVRILARARDLAPRGRHRIVLGPDGEAGLEWADGVVTSLEGQAFLPLDEGGRGLEGLFESAGLAEDEGRLDDAARLYDQCARADAADPIAPFNLGNVQLAAAAHREAILSYRRALERDPAFAEARYNLAQALEGTGQIETAVRELESLVAADPRNCDALFNLAQLKMRAGELSDARGLYERYLDLDPPPDWAAMARKAILICTPRQSA